MTSLRVGDRVDDTSVVLVYHLPKYEKTIFINNFYFLYIFQELSMIFGHMSKLVLFFFFEFNVVHNFCFIVQICPYR